MSNHYSWQEFEKDPQSGEDGPWFIIMANGEVCKSLQSWWGTEYLPDWISDNGGDAARGRSELETSMSIRCHVANAARQEAFAEIDAAAKKVDPERFIHRRLIDPRECAFVADLSAALLAASKGEGDESE